jgi:hypothetical protein
LRTTFFSFFNTPTTHTTSVSFLLKLPESSYHPVPSSSRCQPPKNLVGSNRLHNFQPPISPRPLIIPTNTKQTMHIHAAINGTPQVDDGWSSKPNPQDQPMSICAAT